MKAATGNAAPLSTVARNFTMAKIGQSVSGIGQDNTLSFTLQTNFDLLVRYFLYFVIMQCVQAVDCLVFTRDFVLQYLLKKHAHL